MAPAADSAHEAVSGEPAPVALEQTAATWARFVNGDEDAATKLFARYLERLTALARGRLSARLAARVDADDVAMSAYRSLFIGGRSGRFAVSQPGDLWRLLVEIAMHKLCRQAARHAAQRRSIHAECREGRADDSLWQPISREPSPDAAAALADELAAVMAQFKPAARRVLELRLQGESPSVISAETGCSKRTVRRYLAQARQVVRRRQGFHADRGAQCSRSLPKAQKIGNARRAPRTRFRAVIPDAEAPLAFADFVLQRQLGAGGVGKVYQALHRPTAEVVAVKYLKKSYVRHPHVVARFRHEARLVAALDHPSIVVVRGLGRTPNGGYFLAMDLMPGGDLAERVAHGPASTDDIVRWMRQVAGAIAYAHERGVIHCDLKPSNILLDESGNARVSDFGMAVSPALDLVRPRAVAGTPAFMAPEQIDPVWGPLTPRTDVFGLGAVLFALLTGQAPHRGRRAADVLASAVSGQPVPRPSSLRPEASPELDAICVCCLAKNPAERYASALALGEALSAFTERPPKPPR